MTPEESCFEFLEKRCESTKLKEGVQPYLTIKSPADWTQGYRKILSGGRAIRIESLGDYVVKLEQKLD